MELNAFNKLNTSSFMVATLSYLEVMKYLQHSYISIFLSFIWFLFLLVTENVLQRKYNAIMNLIKWTMLDRAAMMITALPRDQEKAEKPFL